MREVVSSLYETFLTDPLIVLSTSQKTKFHEGYPMRSLADYFYDNFLTSPPYLLSNSQEQP